MSDSSNYLLIGHITADLAPDGRHLGGTVSFAAPVVRAFGLTGQVLTSAAPEEPLLAELAPHVDDVRIVSSSETSTFENIYDAIGRRTQYIRAVASKITPTDIPAEWRSTPLVHLAPLTDEVDPHIAHEFKESTVLLTLQGWLRRWDADGRVRFKTWFDPEVLRDIDIVVFSEEDILEAPELEQQFIGAVEHLIVTRAAKGGTYYHRGVARDYDTPQYEQVNPTGAGDVFAAAVLAGSQLFNGDLFPVVQVAARLAAKSITRVGLDSAPTPEEVQAALALVRADYDAG